jgi:hypothetical protein
MPGGAVAALCCCTVPYAVIVKRLRFGRPAVAATMIANYELVLAS